MSDDVKSAQHTEQKFLRLISRENFSSVAKIKISKKFCGVLALDSIRANVKESVRR